MNFNLDDPLGDLLSDNSNDNDSFFESQTGRKRIGGKSPVKKTAGGKAKLEDLFGIKEESEPQFKVPQIRSSAIKSEKAQPLAMSTPKAKVKTDDNDDILSDLGFDPKKPKSPMTTKSNLFDDILGVMETKRPNTAPSSKLDELGVKRDDVPSTRGTISRQSTDTTENSGVLGQTRPRTATGRRSSNTPPAKDNPLDLFSTPKEKDTIRRPTTPKTRKDGTADWLGLGGDSEPEEPAKPEANKNKDPPPPQPVQDVQKQINSFEIPVPAAATVLPTVTPAISAIPFLMTSSNIEEQNAVQMIQQQESQLVLATQLKNQEVALLEMQKRQHDLLSRQEVKFNELLQKQIHRQNQLEKSIKAQQDRINAHIQLLMTQTPTLYPSNTRDSPEHERPQSTHDKTNVLIELEADVKRLELEKLRLEDLVSNINANYEKEIGMMEKSFRKQIEVLEEHLASVQRRLQNEIEDLHKFYTTKLSVAEEHKQEIKTRLEADSASMKDAHDEEIRRLKKSQEEDLDNLREDHQRMLQTIRQSKLLEFAVVQENGSYLEALRKASSNLESVSGDLQSIRGEIERKLDALHRDREQKLEAREKKVEDSERRLKLVEELAEGERLRLMDLVASLETQLTKLSKDSSEENWILRRNMASLEAEKVSFEKEKTLAREQISRDEKRIEELKEHQLTETQRQMEQIQEERSQLNREKAKLDMAKKLEKNNNFDKSRMEIEAALQVTHEATRQAEHERDRFFKLQRQLETQKRELLEKENTLRCRQEELEQDVALARSNERKAHEAAQQARIAEQSFNEKIAFLQQKMRDLSEKESRLSQERLTLLQDRIELQNLKANLEQNRCSLCRIGERNFELSNVLRPNDGTNAIPVIDDQYLMMQQSQHPVDRLLDETIAESLERMKDTTSRRQWDDLERTPTETRPNEGAINPTDFSKYDPTEDFLKNL